MIRVNWAAARQEFLQLRRTVIVVFITYIPACIGAAYLSMWLFGSYVLGFVVAGAYILALAVMIVRIGFAANRWD